MIDLDCVGVELGGSTILEDVSLSVEEGEFLALVGPNGAGKTTLLGVCNGLLSPSSGSVSVDGHDVAGLSANELGGLVATVPQETTLAFEFDVEDIVAMGRTPHRSRFSLADDTDREAITAALERTDTARFADRSVGELSGGQRQRVLLARALAQSTPVLLLDEPTASLDINHQLETLSLARQLAADGKTVVAAIHDLELAGRFCDTIALLSGGHIEAVGPPAEVLTDERLEATFGVRTAVASNPATGAPTVTPLMESSVGERTKERVHVVGGGAKTAAVVGRLVDVGHEVSVGILPEDDAALPTARRLASDVVTAPAFECVDDTTLETARTLREAASVTVLAAPVGEANRTLAGDSDVLVACEGTDAPPNATVVEVADLPAAISNLSVRASRSQ